MSEEKEPHYFGADLIKTPNFIYYARDVNSYLQLFAQARTEQRVGEASTMYLKSQTAASEIKEFAPEARIIIMLRNPVDMMHSLHSHMVYNGTEDIQCFALALEAEEDRRLGRRIPKGRGLVDGLFYRQVAKYAEQVERYFGVFGRENVQPIIYDDFRADTSKLYNETLRFLGVRQEFKPLFEIVYGNRQPRNSIFRGLWANRPDIVRRLIMDIAPPRLSRGIQGVIKWVGSRNAPRTPLNPDLRRRLNEDMKGEVEQLSDLLGRDLTHWSKE